MDYSRLSKQISDPQQAQRGPRTRRPTEARTHASGSAHWSSRANRNPRFRTRQHHPVLFSQPPGGFVKAEFHHLCPPRRWQHHCTANAIGDHAHRRTSPRHVQLMPQGPTTRERSSRLPTCSTRRSPSAGTAQPSAPAAVGVRLRRIFGDDHPKPTMHPQPRRPPQTFHSRRFVMDSGLTSCVLAPK